MSKSTRQRAKGDKESQRKRMHPRRQQAAERAGLRRVEKDERRRARITELQQIARNKTAAGGA